MLERCRFHFLSQCRESRQALVLGDGDGRFTARLLKENPLVQADAIDSSGAMLRQLQNRVHRNVPQADARLHAIHADVRGLRSGLRKYDLVVSHFFLDCLTEEEVATLVENLQPYCSQHAIWLISEFSILEKGWQRIVSQLLVRSLYLAFSWMTDLRIDRLPNYAKALQSHGFRKLGQQAFLRGLLVSEIWTREL